MQTTKKSARRPAVRQSKTAGAVRKLQAARAAAVRHLHWPLHRSDDLTDRLDAWSARVARMLQ